LKLLKLLSRIGGKTARYTSLAKIGQNRLKAKFFNQVNNCKLGMLKSMKIGLGKTHEKRKTNNEKLKIPLHLFNKTLNSLSNFYDEHISRQ